MYRLGRYTFTSWKQPSSLKILFAIIVCVHMNAGTHAKVHVWKSEDKFWESVLSFHIWVLGSNSSGPGFAANAFTCWTIYLENNQSFFFHRFCYYYFKIYFYYFKLGMHVCVCVHASAGALSCLRHGSPESWSLSRECYSCPLPHPREEILFWSLVLVSHFSLQVY